MREDQVATELRERYAAAAPRIHVDAAAVVQRGRRRRRTTRVLGAAATLALVAVGALAVRGLAPDGSGEAAVPPPPSEPAPVSLWLSSEVVPPGAEVAAVLVNRSQAEPTFGVLATVERWDGGEWDSYGTLAMCLGEWQCTAGLVDSDVAVNDVGLSPAPDAPGPLERFSTEGFDPGWYRISQAAYEGPTASGLLEVREDAPAPAPLPPLGTPSITVAPALVPGSGGTVQLFPVVPAGPDGTLSAEDVEAAIAELEPEAVVERWDGEAWEPAARTAVGTPGLRSASELTLDLPALVEGAYRVVRPHVDGSTDAHTGSFWVVGPDHAPRLPQPDDEADDAADADAAADDDGLATWARAPVDDLS